MQVLMQLATVTAVLSGSSVVMMRPLALSLRD